MKSFLDCKTIEECNEWMKADALDRAAKIRQALQAETVEPHNVEWAKAKITEHEFYASQL